MDFETDYTLLRPCAGVIPLMHAKLNGLRGVWFGSRLEPPQVGIYQPSAAANHQESAEIAYQAAVAFEGTLDAGNIPHATVFERAILEGADSFSRFRVLCLPYAVVLPPRVASQLVAWVRCGGLLIAAGPFGMWDECVRPDARANRALLGKRVPTRTPSGAWALPSGAAFVRVGCGKGDVLLSGNPDVRQRAGFIAAARAALSARVRLPASTDNPSIGLVARRGQPGTLFVTLYNRSSTRETRGTVWVRGRWGRAADLGIAAPAAVPCTARREGVRVPALLAPGEGTVLRFSRR